MGLVVFLSFIYKSLRGIDDFYTGAVVEGKSEGSFGEVSRVFDRLFKNILWALGKLIESTDCVEPDPLFDEFIFVFA